MKKYVHLLLALAVLTSGQLFAQDNQECLQNLSIFAENAKVKNYIAAYEPWAKVKNDCPSLNVAIYSYGERILKDRIKNGEASAKADLIAFMKIGSSISQPNKEEVKSGIFYRVRRKT